MANRKKSRAGAGAARGDKASQAMRDSAQKIWLAGLGAFERAKSDGPRMFETLVSQGKELRGRATEAADQALRTLRDQAGEAQGKWDKLEQVFEDRVARSLNRLGVITKAEVEELASQVRELNESVRGMMKDGGKPARAPKRKAAAKGKARAKKAKRATRA